MQWEILASFYTELGYLCSLFISLSAVQGSSVAYPKHGWAEAEAKAYGWAENKWWSKSKLKQLLIS
jgi:hypothetical protein